MKGKVILGSLIILCSSSYAGGSDVKLIPIKYSEPPASFVTVLKTNRKGNFLLATRNQLSGDVALKNIDTQGNVEWIFFPTFSSKDSRSSTSISDVYQDASGGYLVCVDQLDSNKKPASYSKILFLNVKGELVRTEELMPPPDQYNDNASVQRCWSDQENIYIIRSIFGGTRPQANRELSATFWLQVIQKKGGVIVNKFIPSIVPFHSRITNLVVGDDFVKYSATNGNTSELVYLKIDSERTLQKPVSGVATLIDDINQNVLLSKDGKHYSVLSFDDQLKLLNKQFVSINEKESVLSTYSSGIGKINFVVYELSEKSSKLNLHEFDLIKSQQKTTAVGKWSPPAIFSHFSTRSSKKDVVLYFSQTQLEVSPIKTVNNLIKIQDSSNDK